MTAKQEENINFKGKYFHAVGKRKSAIARVRLYPKGKGRIFVNEKDYKEFFPTKEMQIIIDTPLEKIGSDKEYDISVKVTGGGFKGQAEAIKLGISRALLDMDKDLRPILRKNGLLTRDARVKERKKPGLKKARRAPQWAKR